MPETKEEMYALIHEFDDRVDDMIKIIENFTSNTSDENFSTFDWAMLTVYCHDLWNLKSAYKHIDQTLSSKDYQSRES